MSNRLASALVILILAFCALPGRAQLAYAHVASPTAPGHKADTENEPSATAYKLVHGVVQGQTGVLAGATVWLHGTRTIVVTDSEGEFVLRVPANAKAVKLTCSYGGLQDEIVTLPPVQAMGSVYLLRTRPATLHN